MASLDPEVWPKNQPQPTDPMMRELRNRLRWIWAAIVAILIMVAYDTDTVYHLNQFIHAL